MDVTIEKKGNADMEKAIPVTSNSIGEVFPVTVLEHANTDDGDEALKALANIEEHVVLSEKEDKAFLRKIDFHLMPVSHYSCFSS